MSDQVTTTPGLKDVVALDATRLSREGDPGAWGGPSRRPATAEWLRSPTAYRELMRHHLTDEAGLCGCSERYTSHAQHMLEALALVAER